MELDAKENAIYSSLTVNIMLLKYAFVYPNVWEIQDFMVCMLLVGANLIRSGEAVYPFRCLEHV